MATIVQPPIDTTTTLDVSQSFSLVSTIIGWFFNNFFKFAFLLLFIFVIGVILVIWFMNEEAKKMQEDMLYKEFKNTITSCEKNREDKMYTSYWSKWNLIWFGLPLIKYKVGRKIRDKRQNVIGFYDGMLVDDLNNWNILMWKEKQFIFFKDHFVLRLPTLTFQLRQDKQTKKQIENNEDLKYNVETSPLPKGLVSLSEHDLTINISMIGMKKFGYYFYPIYEDTNHRVLNLQESINAQTKIKHSDELLLNVIKEGGKSVLAMAKQNTQLVYEQRAPEKVKEVQDEQNQ